MPVNEMIAALQAIANSGKGHIEVLQDDFYGICNLRLHTISKIESDDFDIDEGSEVVLFNSYR